jgi:hypothetical protein
MNRSRNYPPGGIVVGYFSVRERPEAVNQAPINLNKQRPQNLGRSKNHSPLNLYDEEYHQSFSLLCCVILEVNGSCSAAQIGTCQCLFFLCERCGRRFGWKRLTGSTLRHSLDKTFHTLLFWRKCGRREYGWGTICHIDSSII